MKKLIGKDIGTYYFKPGWRMVIIENVEYSIEQILLITNVTSNIIIYNFADPALGGYIYNHPEFGKGLKLDYDSSAMVSTDVLQIYLDLPEGNQFQTLEDFNTHDLLEKLDGILFELKVMVALLESGFKGKILANMLDADRIRKDLELGIKMKE